MKVRVITAQVATVATVAVVGYSIGKFNGLIGKALVMNKQAKKTR